MMTKKYYHHPNSYQAEGVDHININPKSEFYVGRVFEPSFLRVINYPFIGKFRSISNLWVWLKVKPLDDSLRRLGLRDVQRILASGNGRDSYVPNFKIIIANATYLKIKNDSVAMDEIKKIPKGTPILSYYRPKGSPVRICSNYANIIIPIVNEIVEAVQEGREPNFFFLAERGFSTNMEYLEPFLVSRLGDKAAVKNYIN